jgi:hypothetical protein
MADYQLTANGQVIIRTADEAHIPCDPGNRDYQAYLAWCTDGYTPDPPPPPPALTEWDVADFVARFTQAEQLAVQAACAANPQLGWGLTVGLARGTITVGGPLLGPWMAGLVAAGAITQARATQIQDPTWNPNGNGH